MIISTLLAGGDPRSLGNTDKVIDYVLRDKTKLTELFDCVDASNEIVRMRACDALEKICRQKPQWFKPYAEAILNRWPEIDQPSVQWHLAQILSEIELKPKEIRLAVNILKNNLGSTDDWIVENLTLESLATFTRKGNFDVDEFISILKLHQNSRHKSVISRINKLLNEFSPIA
jgi:hypothetical protein